MASALPPYARGATSSQQDNRTTDDDNSREVDLQRLPPGAVDDRPRNLPEGFESWRPLKPGGGTLSQLTNELHIAAFNTDVDKVRSILAAGGSTTNKYKVNALDFGTPPLILAVRVAAKDSTADAKMAEIARMLIGAGADVGWLTEQGQNALMLACIYGGGVGKIETVKVLLEAGCDLRQHEKRDKMTALHWAVVSGYANVVEALIAAGASCTTIGGRDRESAAQLAKTRVTKYAKNQATPTGPKEPEERLAQAKRIQHLCEAGEAARLEHKAMKKAANMAKKAVHKSTANASSIAEKTPTGVSSTPPEESPAVDVE